MHLEELASTLVPQHSHQPNSAMDNLTISTSEHPGTVAPLLKRPEVERMTSLSRTTLYRLIQQDQFPKPVQLTARAVAWRSSDVAAWIASRVAGVRSAKA